MGVKSSLWQVRIALCAWYSSIISPGAYAWVGLDGLSHHLDVFSRPPSSSVARVSFIPVQTGSMISILSHIVPDGSFYLEAASRGTAPEKPLELPRNFLFPGIELPGILSAQLSTVPCLESM